MSNTKDSCTACGRPVKSDSKGSLTQWVFLCKCDSRSPQVSLANTIRICANCGKRIGAGRSGSFTQWIFRAEVCDCTNPEAVERTVKSLSDQEYAGSIVDLSDITEVEVSKERFPIDRFAPIEVLGATYDSTVYLSIDKMLGTRVAVKSVDMRNLDSLVRFQKEVKALAKLVHPGIVKVLDFAEYEGAPYMVMEYIDGITIRELLEKHKKLTTEDTKTVISNLSKTLSYCHSKNILHRDIKPENALVSVDKEPVEIKLVDFGLACTYDTVTKQSETIAGTPVYMAPDVGKGGNYDKRSEIYSLGCVMFELLEGKPPYQDDNPLVLLKLHADAEIPKLSSKIDTKLANIVYKCLAKEPGDRFQSMEELSTALSDLDSEQLADSEVLEEPLASGPTVASKLEELAKEKPTRKKVQLAPIVLLVVLVGILIGAIYFYVISSGDNSKVAQVPEEKEVKIDSNPLKDNKMESYVEGELNRVPEPNASVDNKYLDMLLTYHSPKMKEVILKSDKDVDIQKLRKVFRKIQFQSITFGGKLCSPKYIRNARYDKRLRLIRLERPTLKNVAAIPKGMQRMTVVVLNKGKITAKHIKLLRGIPKLNHMRFNFSKLDKGCITAISKSPVVNLSMATCAYYLDDLASFTQREDMQFLRLKGCRIVDKDRSIDDVRIRQKTKENLASGLMELTVGDVLDASNELMDVIAKMKLRRIYLENYIFSTSDILKLGKIKNLKRIDFRKCVLGVGSLRELHQLRPKLELHKEYCMSTTMDSK